MLTNTHPIPYTGPLLISANLLAVLLSSYFSLGALAFFTQGKLQYRPTYRDALGRGTPFLKPWRRADGVFLGYVTEPASPPERVILFFHGMGGEALNWEWYARIVSPRHVLVLAEYPGYGAKSGEPSEKAFFLAAETIFDELKKRWNAPVTVIGESLGSGVACYLAANRPVERLGLVSPFTSVADVAQHHLPFLPITMLLRDKFLSTRFTSSLAIPLHVIHGDADQVVPVKFGRRLFEDYPGVTKTLTILPGFNHYSINRAVAKLGGGDPFRQFINN